MLSLTEKLHKMLKTCAVLRPGVTVIAACSGGADSLTLTDTLFRLSKEMGFVLCVMHVQHHLRGVEAASDALLVADFCTKRHLIYKQVDVDVKKLVSSEGISVEDAARKLRYEALENYRQEIRAVAIFLAHHRDDQAETVLLNLLRGAGVRGLRGMLPQNDFLVRPFLQATREEMECYCAEQNITFCSDSTNDNIEYKRNWVRKELLPLLEHINPQIKKSLSQVATLAAMDEEYLEMQARKYLTAYGVKIGVAYELDVGDEFLQLHLALQTRIVRLMASEINAGEFNYEHVRAVVALVVKGTSGKSLNLPGSRAFYAKKKLRVEINTALRNSKNLKLLKEKLEHE